MPIGPGSSAGPYEVLGVLGAGAMGTVYLARDRRLGRQVALKVLHLDDRDHESRRRRILHEARAASALNHPNICQIYDVGEADGAAWIAMEYIEGQPLQVAVPEHGLPPVAVIKLGVQLAEALAHAHERGVLHRDLKTANVVLTQDGRPKILDFGLAVSLPGRVAAAATRTSVTMESVTGAAGTVPYMAPEVLRGDAADERSDLWSLGKSIYFFQTKPTQTFRRISADGGVSTEFRPWRWETENTPAFDPTGRLVAFTRQRAPGAPPGGARDATIIEDVQTGSQREMPGEHMHVRQWSADGGSILGWRHDGKAWTCRVADFTCRPIADGNFPVWSGDEQRVFVVRPSMNIAAPQDVWSVKADGTDEQHVASLGRFRQIDRFFDVSKGGQLVWSPFIEGRHEVWTASLVEHR